MDAIKLSKLRKLLRLAADGSNPHESSLAARRALELVGDDNKRDFVEVTDLPPGYRAVTGVFCRRTEKAAFIDFLELPEPIWLPISQLTEESQDCVDSADAGDEIEIAVPDWLLAKHGL